MNMDRYRIELLVDYGKEKVHASDPGDRVAVIKALHDGIVASEQPNAKVTIIIRDPSGNESVHRYAAGKKVN